MLVLNRNAYSPSLYTHVEDDKQDTMLSELYVYIYTYIHICACYFTNGTVFVIQYVCHYFSAYVVT